MTYFHRRMPTIIGAGAFHRPVRDGKGWFHSAMVVRQRGEGQASSLGWCLSQHSNCLGAVDLSISSQLFHTLLDTQRVWKKVGLVVSILATHLRCRLMGNAQFRKTIGSSLTGN